MSSAAPPSAANNPYHRNNPVRQFEAWDQEAQAFRKEAREMDERRAGVEARLAETRREQSEWQERLHRASDSLGGAHRRRDMLQAEQTRLRATLANERDALVECATNIEQLCRTEANEKKAYCADLAEGNRELGRLLQKQEDLRLRKLLHPDVVEVLLEHYGAPAEGAEGANTSPDSRDANTAALEDLTAAVHELREQAAVYRGVVTQRDQMRARLLACRARALNATNGSGETGDSQVSPTQLQHICKAIDTYPLRLLHVISCSQAFDCSQPGGARSAVGPRHVGRHGRLYYNGVGGDHSRCGGNANRRRARGYPTQPSSRDDNCSWRYGCPSPRPPAALLPRRHRRECISSGGQLPSDRRLAPRRSPVLPTAMPRVAWRKSRLENPSE